jgi:hypothetical protein
MRKTIKERLARLEANAARQERGPVLHLLGDPEPTRVLGQSVIRIGFVCPESAAIGDIRHQPGVRRDPNCRDSASRFGETA